MAKNEYSKRVSGKASDFLTKGVEQSDPKGYSRREAIHALGKYSAYAGTTAVVLLSAEDVVASTFLSSCYSQCRGANDPQYGNEACYEGCRIQDKMNNDINN